ncbi:alanine--tRNA ligase [Segetibacter koreensis]|uniref:alanine--tRNA ligase n=1 Tax=Segetibacter koreensis TaxID=398037 RepID=UPI0003A6B348|nr:alanine--tRNA ligase [Segetibacter koreensis]
MMTSADIRSQFLLFFAEKKHQIVPSAPIVVKNDPTLLFTNAGMNQFKEYFLGNKKPEYSRVADTQKCLRVSGKHNDLEEVGVDTYHHTMFEMLGNWSFGDYFKAEAIAWSWELLTKIYKIDTERLYVTVFEGSEAEGLPKDEEAFDEWKKVISEDRILFGNKKDNFWEMGDTGPCGPCTEIHYDSRSEEERKAVDGKNLVNKDHPQVIEIWNNVFIQFNRLKDGNLEALPARHVDTGMGLERLVRVLQGKNSNYDTDLFTGTIAETERITGKKYTNSDDKKDVAFRVIADHIRAIAFTIADGQLPSNTGAGYVIRRILRRAVRYYYSYLDYKQPLLCELIPVLGKQFELVFPELFAQINFVQRVVTEEEEGFLRTLDKGLKKIDDIIHLKETIANATINGEAAFELFDTYGFPIDLTRLIAAENNLQVDEQGFEKEMQQQKQRSRAATIIDAADWVVLDEEASSEFIGYDMLQVKSKVVKYRKVSAKGKEAYHLVLNATPFYAESGGQVGDKGELIFGDQAIDVIDTKKENNLTIHFTHQLPEEIDSDVIARVNKTLRKSTEGHHTATHLLHAALRQVLGTHVAQKGSLVNSQHLRFDFSHFAKVTDEEMAKIEAIVNEKIRENVPVVIKEMTKEEAIKLGAMALFGEKYGDMVRVVIIDPKYSIELCGGTHVLNTGELGFFKIKNESAVAAGVRRIEAVSGTAAEHYVTENFTALQEIKDFLKNPKDVKKAIENLQLENTELRKKIESFEAKQLSAIKSDLLNKVENVNGISFLGQLVEVSNGDNLKKLCLDLKPHLQNYVVVLAANTGGKASVAIMVDEEVGTAKNLDAIKIIKEQVAPLIKGGGGGQKTLATAGGQDAGNLSLVVEKVKGLL